MDIYDFYRLQDGAELYAFLESGKKIHGRKITDGEIQWSDKDNELEINNIEVYYSVATLEWYTKQGLRVELVDSEDRNQLLRVFATKRDG